MRRRESVFLCTLAGLSVITFAPAHAQQQTTPPAPPSAAARANPSSPTRIIDPTPSEDAPGAERFSGVWDYNAEESINANTGRQEQAPRSATSRRPGAGRGGPTGTAPAGGRSGGSSSGSGSGGSGGNGGGTGGNGGGGGGVNSGMPAGGGMGGGMPGYGGGGGMGTGGLGFGRTIFDTRDLVRDLTEVPESFEITVTPETVKFVDDLDRDQTYLTDGKKQKYILGAAQYAAKAMWQGKQFRKEIEGPYGFRMTETYFLSGDGRRLFVIVRVGDPTKKDAVTIAINRVYDRLDRE